MELNEDEIGTIIVDTAVNLHKNLGPGLLEIDQYKTWLHSEFWDELNEKWDNQDC